MIKTFTFFSLIFFFNISTAQNINIPDSVFLQTLINQGVDLNGDGLIQLTEADQVTTLNVGNKGISDLTGINNFYNLTDLDCSGNRINFLNIKDLPNLERIKCHDSKINTLLLENLVQLIILRCENNYLNALNLNSLNALKYLYCSNNNLSQLEFDTNFDMRVIACNANMLSALDVGHLTQLRRLECHRQAWFNNPLSTLNVANCSLLEHLNFAFNKVESIDISLCGNLKEIYCNYNRLDSLSIKNSPFLKELICNNNVWMTLHLSGTSSLERLICHNISTEELDFTQSPNLVHLECNNSKIRILDLRNTKALEYLDCSSNKLNEIDVSQSVNLKHLSCYSNQLVNLGLSNNVALEYLHCSTNDLINIHLNQSNILHTINCNYNLLTELNIGQSDSLITLECGNNNLSELNVLGAKSLERLYCNNNNISQLNLSQSTKLSYLNCSYNGLEIIDFSNLKLLETLNLRENKLGYIDLHNNVNLKEIYALRAGITYLNLSGCRSIEEIYLHNYNSTSTISETNNINILNVSDCVALRILDCADLKNLSTLNVNGLQNLIEVDLENTNLSSVDLSSAINLKDLNITGLNLVKLNLDNCSALEEIDASEAAIDLLDLSSCSNLEYIKLDSKSDVTAIDMKNGKEQRFSISSNSNTPIEYICCDEVEKDAIVQRYLSSNASLPLINSNCDLIEGENIYRLNIDSQFSFDDEICGTNDELFPFIKYELINNSSTNVLHANANGHLSTFFTSGFYSFMPQLDNYPHLESTPQRVNITIDSLSSDTLINFCITSNADIYDLAVQLIPLTEARAGFDAKYELLYSNKGTLTTDGTVSLRIPHPLVSFLNASIQPDEISNNMLRWDFTDLQVFEQRSIILNFNLNSPVDSPSLNSGDVLEWQAEISSEFEDHNIKDNRFLLSQPVVNSYDPNDKQCLEGQLLTPELIGEYVHYKIRFENIGTASAIHVIIEDEINLDVFELNTLQVISSSHNFITRITKPNNVKFVFENINLPFEDEFNDGYVLFKIKTKDHLVVGDTIQNSAQIFFDFNEAVKTNTAQSQIVLNTSTYQIHQNKPEVNIYPNPSDNYIICSSSQAINQISIYQISGKLVLNKSIIDGRHNSKIDLEELIPGIYIIKVRITEFEIIDKIIII